MRAMNLLMRIRLMPEDWKITKKKVKSLISCIYFNLEICVHKI